MNREIKKLQTISYCIENEEETLVSHIKNPSHPYLKKQKDIIETIKRWAKNKNMEVKWIKLGRSPIYSKNI